jgi:hypothetical protein
MELSTIDALNAQLLEIYASLEKAQERLTATPEWVECDRLIGQVKSLQTSIQEEKYRLDQEVYETTKAEIITAGFEVRTGHTTSSTNHRSTQSQNGETWKFLILNSKLPKVEHIDETSGDTNVCFDGVESDDALSSLQMVLGYGETEQEAWSDAITTWNYDEDRKRVLAFTI